MIDSTDWCPHRGQTQIQHEDVIFEENYKQLSRRNEMESNSGPLRTAKPSIVTLVG
jgi:hypothetical protein